MVGYEIWLSYRGRDERLDNLACSIQSRDQYGQPSLCILGLLILLYYNLRRAVPLFSQQTNTSTEGRLLQNITLKIVHVAFHLRSKINNNSKVNFVVCHGKSQLWFIII